MSTIFNPPTFMGLPTDEERLRAEGYEASGRFMVRFRRLPMVLPAPLPEAPDLARKVFDMTLRAIKTGR